MTNKTDWHSSESYTENSLNLTDEAQISQDGETEEAQIITNINYEFNVQSINYVIIIENN